MARYVRWRQPDGAPSLLGVRQEHPSADGALLLDADASLHGLGRERTTPAVAPASLATAVDYEAEQVFFDGAQPGTGWAIEERHEFVAIQRTLDWHALGFFFQTLAAFGQFGHAGDGARYFISTIAGDVGTRKIE